MWDSMENCTCYRFNPNIARSLDLGISTRQKTSGVWGNSDHEEECYYEFILLL